MNQLLWIAGAGAGGSLLRYLIFKWVHRHYGFAFPYGTLIVNIIGSGGFGWLINLPADAGLIDILCAGLLGGLTTFSAFSYDTMHLLHIYRRLYAGTNIALHLLLCPAACGLGMWLAI